jgi:hypothetical protein
MYSMRERLWIDLSDIFCQEEIYYAAIAKKISSYCTYDIEEIKKIFFHEVAPACKSSEGYCAYDFSFDEKLLIKRIKKILNSNILIFYNKIFYYNILEKTCAKQWQLFEKNLIKYNQPKAV